LERCDTLGSGRALNLLRPAAGLGAPSVETEFRIDYYGTQERSKAGEGGYKTGSRTCEIALRLVSGEGDAPPPPIPWHHDGAAAAAARRGIAWRCSRTECQITFRA
jgi:hypothetical protein